MSNCSICGKVTAFGLCKDCAAKLAVYSPTAKNIAKPEQNPRYDQQWFFKSESRPGVQYKVSRKGDEYQCSCEAWKFRLRKIGKDCKHITQVKAEQVAANLTIEPEVPKPAVRRRLFRLGDES